MAIVVHRRPSPPSVFGSAGGSEVEESSAPRANLLASGFESKRERRLLARDRLRARLLRDEPIRRGAKPRVRVRDGDDVRRRRRRIARDSKSRRVVRLRRRAKFAFQRHQRRGFRRRRFRLAFFAVLAVLTILDGSRRARRVVAPGAKRFARSRRLARRRRRLRLFAPPRSPPRVVRRPNLSLDRHPRPPTSPRGPRRRLALRRARRVPTPTRRRFRRFWRGFGAFAFRRRVASRAKGRSVGHGFIRRFRLRAATRDERRGVREERVPAAAPRRGGGVRGRRRADADAAHRADADADADADASRWVERCAIGVGGRRRGGMRGRRRVRGCGRRAGVRSPLGRVRLGGGGGGGRRGRGLARGIVDGRVGCGARRVSARLGAARGREGRERGERR